MESRSFFLLWLKWYSRQGQWIKSSYQANQPISKIPQGWHQKCDAKAMVIKSGKVPKENYTMLPRSCLLAFFGSRAEGRELWVPCNVSPIGWQPRISTKKTGPWFFLVFFFGWFIFEPPPQKKTIQVKLVYCIKRIYYRFIYPFAFWGILIISLFFGGQNPLNQTGWWCGDVWFSRYLPAWIQRSVSFNHQARKPWVFLVVAGWSWLNPQRRRIPAKSYRMLGGFCILDRLLMFFCILFIVW